jgi:hypothetical protein
MGYYILKLMSKATLQQSIALAGDETDNETLKICGMLHTYVDDKWVNTEIITCQHFNFEMHRYTYIVGFLTANIYINGDSICGTYYHSDTSERVTLYIDILTNLIYTISDDHVDEHNNSFNVFQWNMIDEDWLFHCADIGTSHKRDPDYTYFTLNDEYCIRLSHKLIKQYRPYVHDFSARYNDCKIIVH